MAAALLPGALVTGAFVVLRWGVVPRLMIVFLCSTFLMVGDHSLALQGVVTLKLSHATVGRVRSKR